MKDLFTGARYLAAGLRLIRQPGLRRYVIGPLAISTIIFASVIVLAPSWIDALVELLLGYLPDWLDWLRYLLWPLFALGGLLIVFYSFSIFANLLGAPFNGLLAEAVERHLTGQAVGETGGWRTLARDLLPSLFSEVRKLLYFVLWAIPFGIAFLIPPLSPAAPFLWAFFSAWMLAIEYCDYPMANHLLHFGAQRKILRRRRMLALGFGGGTLVLTLIPIANFFVMPVAVAGATAMWVKEWREDHLRGASTAQSG
jgi:CysZ protein